MATSRHHIKHRNQVRIIGGQYRGRKITFANESGLRPTPDMVRERLFNWLGQDLTGKKVLDLFSGSGVLGFEAISRGACSVTLVESNRRIIDQLQYHAQQLQSHRLTVRHIDALAFIQSTAQQFDIIFLDPPYQWQLWHVLWPHIIDKLSEKGLVYAESGERLVYPETLSLLKQGNAGKSHFYLLQKDVYQEVNQNESTKTSSVES